MDFPAWKKWPFHLQNVSSLLGRLAGPAAIQGQLLKGIFKIRVFSPEGAEPLKTHTYTQLGRLKSNLIWGCQGRCSVSLFSVSSSLSR